MMSKEYLLAGVMLAGLIAGRPVLAQSDKNNSFNQGRVSVGGGGSSAFNKNRVGNFNDYRQKLNAEYVSKTREKWLSFNSVRGMDIPDRDVKPVEPIRMSDEDARRERQDRQITIETVVRPVKPAPRPQPPAPVRETPEPAPQYLSFSYLGNSCKVRRPQGSVVRLAGVSENAVADAWERLCSEQYNNLIVDCMKLRNEKQLCDWAYLLMLRDMAEALCGRTTNEATLLMAFVYSQSGYKIRLGQAGGRLEMLYACQHNIYNRSYYTLDGEKFYAFNKEVKSVNINAARYPKEQSLSLWVPRTPQAAFQPAAPRRLTAKRYPDMTATVTANKQLLSFFDTYPTSEVGGNFMTRWAMYANTPLSGEVQAELYPQLRRALSGLSQQMAVERLLNWVQTAFVYEYDDKVWGGDRAFFPDETLHYPYCDCEDRSILFTRLVRDLVGLPCVLVYYPGHLASAVAFSESVGGDYIQAQGKRFVVCDPTYIGAPVGRTMPKMDNASAKVILLQ